MTTERDLIQQLTERLDHLHSNYDLPSQSALIAEALDYLDQPEPEYPSDQELLELMTEQHRATESEWHCLKARTCGDKSDQVAYSTIHELLHRIEALEAARRPKPPSLHEQGMRILTENGTTLDGRIELDPEDIDTFHAVLKRLKQLEESND